jgi:hypothetical protein
LENAGVGGYLIELEQLGCAWVRDGFETAADAFAAARALIDVRCRVDGVAHLDVIGEFVLPPMDAAQTRAFQTLHFDFGLPVNPVLAHDVGLYTALYIPADFGKVSAVTRLVPLAALLGQRAWPSRSEVLARLVAYGRTHGAWDDARGYVEGSLARFVEAAGGSPRLPSVKAEPDFLCGTEFDSLGAEVAFFVRHSLDVEAVQVEVALSPGELLVFNNFAVAHGRRGVRLPGELRQRVFGERGLAVAGQRKLRDRVLDLIPK